MIQHIDSVCPKCNGVNKVQSNGSPFLHVNCKHCSDSHGYEHVLHLIGTTSADTRHDKLHLVEEMIVSRKYERISDRTTICLLTFENGYESVGKATVKNMNDFHVVMGQDKAYEDALKRAFVAFGGLLGN